MGSRVHLRLTLPALVGWEIPSHLEPALAELLASVYRQVRWEWEDPTLEGRAYYRTFRIQNHVQHPVLEERNLVDGGALDGTQTLLQNGSEKLVPSGIGSGRLRKPFPGTPAIRRTLPSTEGNLEDEPPA